MSSIRRLLSISIGAFGASAACSGPPVTVVTTTAPSGGYAYIISCEESPRHCQEKAREVCPFGQSTLDPGSGGWYAEGEDFHRAQAKQAPDKPLYKLEGWVIRCVQPMIGR